MKCWKGGCNRDPHPRSVLYCLLHDRRRYFSAEHERAMVAADLERLMPKKVLGPSPTLVIYDEAKVQPKVETQVQKQVQPKVQPKKQKRGRGAPPIIVGERKVRTPLPKPEGTCAHNECTKKLESNLSRFCWIHS